jgi:VanZ family protein
VLNRFFWAAFSWTVFITVLCLVNSSSLDEIDVIEIPDKDKIVHFSFYFIFTIAWYLFFKSKYGGGTKIRTFVFALAVFYGGLIEIVQLLFTSGRSADVMDAVANSAGSALAVLILWLYKKLKN